MKLKFTIFLAACLVSGPSLAEEFYDQLKACHDTVWQMDEFKDLPNAAVSVHLGGYDDKSFYAYWIIDWDDLQVAGKCLMDRNKPIITKITDFRKK